MPGPRKNLTPLDMKMMGLAFNQGGVINFLGKQPEVTAPVRAQSHADSPPVQLAYITDAEKDLLVKSNIHGSMDGKPNPGPAGLPSLDDFFNIPGGGIGGGSTSNTGGSVGGGGSGGGGTSAEDYGIGAGQAVGGSDSGTLFVPTTQTPDRPGGFTQADAAAQEAALLQSQIAQEKAAVEAAKKAALEQAGVDQAQTVQDTLLGRIKTKIMGGGEGGDLDLTKEEAYADLPAGMHPLRKQYEYLAKKYGPNWKNTTQAKVLEGYLSGVPVERGGGLGARDETYGGGEFRTETGAIDPELEKRRQDILTKVAAGMYTPNTLASLFQDLEREGIGADLTADQFFNFRQQLMAADPSPENQAYKSALPFSSGAGLGALSRFIPGMGALQTFAGGLFPERDLTGYQQNIDPISVGFQPLPSPDPGSNPSGFFERKTRPPFQVTLPDPSQPKDPRYPLPGDPGRPPFRPPFMPGTGIETVFNPMFLGPSFRGSPYTNRGVSPAFYQALTNFPGMA
jgi:hypothetical protein